MQMPNSNLPEPRRILIVRLSAHGDTVQTLPLLTALKQQIPDAHVGWLVEASAAPLLENHPLIDRLHVADRKRWLRSLRGSLLNPGRWGELVRTLGELRAFVAQLRQEQYEVSIDVQGLLKSALWPWLARIPRRIGYARAREGASMLYSETVPPMEIRNAQQGAVRKYLTFLRPLGLQVPETIACVLPPVPEAIRERIDGLLPGRPMVALAPATRWPSKHWPVSHWQELLQRLVSANVQVVLLGGPADAALNAEIRQGAFPENNVCDLSGKTALNELYALMERVEVLVGPDSAPLHLADAVSMNAKGPKMIALFGPTAPGRTGPVGPGHRVLSTELSCQPCFERHCPIRTHACMQALSPAQVFEAVEQALGREVR